MATKRKIACHDVVPDCDYVATASTEEELLSQVAEHAAHAHGVKELSPELLQKVKSAVREVD